MSKEMYTQGKWKVVAHENSPCGLPNRYAVMSGKKVVVSLFKNEADAYLIAAAPDLLEACKEALRGLNGILETQHREGKHSNHFTIMLEQAISKAEGK